MILSYNVFILIIIITQLFGLSAEDTNFTIPFNVSEECAFDNHAFLEFELIQSLSGETVSI